MPVRIEHISGLEDNVTLRPGMIDAHTLGLSEFGSPEIQFVLVCPHSMASAILKEVGRKIADGLTLEDGMCLSGLENLRSKVMVWETKDRNGEKVFRLIVADGEGSFRSGDWPYSEQYKSPYVGD